MSSDEHNICCDCGGDMILRREIRGDGYNIIFEAISEEMQERLENETVIVINDVQLETIGIVLEAFSNKMLDNLLNPSLSDKRKRWARKQLDIIQPIITSIEDEFE